VTINELLSEWRGYAWPGQVIRLAMLATHYRQPLDFSEHALGQAVNALAEFAHFAEFDDDDTLPSAEFLDAICDDLNTPKAITELHQLAKQSRSTGLLRAIKPGQRVPSGDFDGISPHAQLAAGLRFLGIERKSYNKNWMQDQLQDAMNSQRRKAVDVLVTARLEARKAKNWAEGDRIRDELAAMGVAIKDNKDGTTDWEVKR
ncbi:MAG: CysS/YqeB C-terminal domain-containing protein, partial [Methylococcales bacterium]